MVKQVGIVEMAFDAIDGKTKSIIKTAVFFRCKPSSYRETTQE